MLCPAMHYALCIMYYVLCIMYMYVRRKSRGMPEMFCLIRYEREGLRKVGKKLFEGGLVWVGLGWFVGLV